jgi:cytokinin dehydrogenase
MPSDLLPDPPGGMTGLGFDPGSRTWTTNLIPGTVPIPAFAGRLRLDADALSWASRDWGNIMHRRPLAVLEPSSPDDVALMVGFAGEHRLPLAARGSGHSGYGQCQADGVVIDMSKLNSLHALNEDSVVVDAGMTWSQLLAVVANSTSSGTLVVVGTLRRRLTTNSPTHGRAHPMCP